MNSFDTGDRRIAVKYQSVVRDGERVLMTRIYAPDDMIVEIHVPSGRYAKKDLRLSLIDLGIKRLRLKRIRNQPTSWWNETTVL